MTQYAYFEGAIVAIEDAKRGLGGFVMGTNHPNRNPSLSQFSQSRK
jgi:hypothetical protein